MTDEAREQIKQDCERDEAARWSAIEEILHYLTELARCALCFKVCDRDLMKEVDLDVKGNRQLICEDCFEGGEIA